MFSEDLGRGLRDKFDELEERRGEEDGAGGGEGHESCEAGVRLSEDGVTVPGDDLAGCEVVAEVVGYGFGCGRGGDLAFELLDEAENVLRGESTGCQQDSEAEIMVTNSPMQRPSEALQTGGVAEEGIAECTADEVRGMC